MSDNDELRAHGTRKTLAQFQPSTESWFIFLSQLFVLYVYIYKITVKWLKVKKS